LHARWLPVFNSSNDRSSRPASWTAREVDATGNFDIEYAPGEGRALRTKKLRYASVAMGKISLRCASM